MTLTDYTPRPGLCLIRVAEGESEYKGTDLTIPDSYREQQAWGEVVSAPLVSVTNVFTWGDQSKTRQIWHPSFTVGNFVLYDRRRACDMWEGEQCFSWVKIEHVYAVLTDDGLTPCGKWLLVELPERDETTMAEGVEVEELPSGLVIAHTGESKVETGIALHVPSGELVEVLSESREGFAMVRALDAKPGESSVEVPGEDLKMQTESAGEVDNWEPPESAVVASVGPLVQVVKPGDRVALTQDNVLEFQYRGKWYVVLNEKDVEVVIE